MTSTQERVDAYISEQMPRWIDELSRLCRQPSVSARHEGVEQCANLVAELLRARGFLAEVTPESGGHPVVLAQRAGLPGAGRKLLFYNHYDVQPPEPLELWTNPPFEPVLRDGALYARGAKDDKGEFIARLAALDALEAIYGGYPCDVTFWVEGEEEIGSPHLPEWVAAHADRLQADAAIWEEGGIDADGHPNLALGARGLLYVELSVTTLSRDAHSGSANLLPNADWRLVWALAGLKGPDERVRIPGFYDAVLEPSPRQEQLLALLPGQEESTKAQYGLEHLLLDRQGPAVARATFDPTCNIAGMGGGYQGEGAKTIVPARAMAKIDFRLVPDQDPHDILRKLRTHLDSQGFPDVQIDVLGAERPSAVDPDAPVVQLTAATALEVYGLPARLIPMMGGTTPRYLVSDRGIPVVTPGVGYEANGAHGPDEHVRLQDFQRAVQHIARLVQRFGAGQ
jgi:acetylornithine deacetylase/succinyl-diaminopimelate desuccinylase-like protein